MKKLLIIIIMCSSCNLTRYNVINTELTNLIVNTSIDCINNWGKEKENKIYTQQHNFTINYNTKQIWLIDSKDTMTILHIHPIK